jgi:hypothetical protein
VNTNGGRLERRHRRTAIERQRGVWRQRHDRFDDRGGHDILLRVAPADQDERGGGERRACEQRYQESGVGGRPLRLRDNCWRDTRLRRRSASSIAKRVRNVTQPILGIALQTSTKQRDHAGRQRGRQARPVGILMNDDRENVRRGLTENAATPVNIS